MSRQPLALVVMAKYPRAGRVKTRLQPALSGEQAAAVHGLFLRHLVRRLCGLVGADVVICHDPPDSGDLMRRLLENAPVCRLPQGPGDLGARLAMADAALARRYGRRLFLGADSPDLPLRSLRAAVDLTERAQVTVGLSEDGGYWCLGLRGEVDAGALLRGIAWSSGQEARQTLERAEHLQLSTATAPRWADVDRPADLERLLRRLQRSSEAEDQDLLRQLKQVLPAPWATGSHGARP